MKSDLNNPVKLDDLALSDPNKYGEYAVKYSDDVLLDLLNQCREDPEKRNAIIQILKIQGKLSDVLENDIGDNLDLKTLINMFYEDTNQLSYRNFLINTGAEDPELAFKCGLLRDLTLLISGIDLPDLEISFLNSFKIDLSNISLLNKIKNELEQDLHAVYSVPFSCFLNIK